ncbi:ribosomal RNA-processing protein 17 [Geosmithia morbida]|uniref:Ribosomal RNA-processing protein 17 n=1 Tax=Geosmithia morbida TaxID=1094350 RepID=A0A9P4YR43_9HYPO|nr:ribosomal RNA-processing protein 17 [Geosmithia morbida]KAF4120163.1 ribosomal RNA-processing protein 17 [Geosmithia morbida]
MFAKPRPKKSLAPPPKKRKAPTIEEINFDFDARHEYLTGFHKRKLQRQKYAQEEAAKKERQEKIEIRKQAREERKREVEDHVNMVNSLLKQSGHIGASGETSSSEDDADNDQDEFEGFPDRPNLDMVDDEEEYIDEDRYTTVTVETVDISRDGLNKPATREEEAAAAAAAEEKRKKYAEAAAAEEEAKAKKEDAKQKKKKKKFRYETKLERSLNDRKQKAKNHKKKAERTE